MYNNLKLTVGAYVLMQDVDRYDDVNYASEPDAHDAMIAAQDDGEQGMWIGIVELINDKPEIIFVDGESE